MVKPVDEEPEVTLNSWVLFHQHGVGFRIAGIHAGTKSGRVSSPLVAFEGLTCTGRTESGRVYRLVGEADPATAALIMAAYAKQWGMSVLDVRRASVEEVALVFAPKPTERWH